MLGEYENRTRIHEALILLDRLLEDVWEGVIQ